MIPETGQEGVGNGLTCGQCGLVAGQVCHPEGVHDAGDDHGAVDAGKPEDLAQQHRQQDGRQAVGSRHQRFEHGHDRLGQDHACGFLQQHVEGVQGQDNRQDRDQHLEGARHPHRHLLGQTDGDVVALEPGIDLSRIDGANKSGKDALTGEILGGDGAVFVLRCHQHERHQRQQARGDGVQGVLLGQAGCDAHRDEDRHQPHAHVEGQHEFGTIGVGKIEPGSGKAPGGFAGDGWEDEDQHEAADDHERQRGNKTVTDGQNIALLAQFSCQWADPLFDQLDQHPIE